MPTITFDQLKGAGILNPDNFTANKTYNVTMGAPTCTGSAYFTMEAVRNEDGFYDGSSAVPAKAKIINFVNISQDTLIENIINSTDHKWSVVIPPGGGTFQYIPFNVTMFADTILLRGTGGITFTYADAIFVFTSKAQLQTAVKAGYVNEFTDRFEDGLDTLIGERGVKLSGGQRQRIAIARAILADPKIIILDEATSNLDTESESLIQKSLETLTQNRTTIVIAHRLSTIKRADQILVIENGQIAEQGNHDTLIAKEGRYYDLYTYQSKI